MAEEALTKIIARSGLCSRRQAEKLIKEGAVKINGQPAFVGQTATAEKDRIEVSGKVLKEAPKFVYLKLNKPAGYTCSNRHFPGEKNIFDLLKTKERLFTVGRLDKDSRGLLLLSNDGQLALELTHPRYGHEKKYEIQLASDPENGQKIAKELEKGIDIGEGDGVVKAKNARYLQKGLFIIILSEGKKRQIRRMFSALNLQVKDLKRTAIGTLDIGRLKEGFYEELSQEEINKLRRGD